MQTTSQNTSLNARMSRRFVESPRFRPINNSIQGNACNWATICTAFNTMDQCSPIKCDVVQIDLFAIESFNTMGTSHDKVAHNPSAAPTSGNIPLPRFNIPHLSTNSFALSPFASPTSVAFSPMSNPFIWSCFSNSFRFVGLIPKIVYGHIPNVANADSPYISALG